MINLNHSKHDSNATPVVGQGVKEKSSVSIEKPKNENCKRKRKQKVRRTNYSTEEGKEIVEAIRQELEENNYVSQAKVALKFNVGETLVSKIKNGKHTGNAHSGFPKPGFSYPCFRLFQFFFCFLPRPPVPLNTHSSPPP